mmetsp:Transcript_13633/g.28147  ORF Transcript_13633/g.28147 Transcript_13633/m.28147 type:complete len:205 (+) Transcript_13633:1060-1674(+)
MKCQQEWDEDPFIGSYGNLNNEVLGSVHGRASSLYSASVGRLCHGEEYQYCPSYIRGSSHCSITIKHGEVVLNYDTATPTRNQPCDEVYKFKIPVARPVARTRPTPRPTPSGSTSTSDTPFFIHDDFPAHTPRPTSRPTPEPTGTPSLIIHDDSRRIHAETDKDAHQDPRLLSLLMTISRPYHPLLPPNILRNIQPNIQPNKSR